jgi:hypothetical protein
MAIYQLAKTQKEFVVPLWWIGFCWRRKIAGGETD